MNIAKSTTATRCMFCASSKSCSVCKKLCVSFVECVVHVPWLELLDYIVRTHDVQLLMRGLATAALCFANKPRHRSTLFC